jgi:S1-C subfamily serine protease
MSGLWLEERAGKVTVADVSPLSPAAEAALAEGDELVEASIAVALRKLAGKPGTRVPLRVRRGGSERDVALTLRPYI